jgi:hypothetical protein
MRGRPKLEDTKKQQVTARVSPDIRGAIKALALAQRRTESQIIGLLLEESPQLQSQLRRNGAKR